MVKHFLSKPNLDSRNEKLRRNSSREFEEKAKMKT
jgi:hypothetical protein